MFSDYVVDFIWPPDASTGPGAKVMRSVCEGRSPFLIDVVMVPNEQYVELSERFFSTSRITMIG